MKRYGLLAVVAVLALVYVAGAESISKQFFGDSYGIAKVDGDTATGNTTLTVTNLVALTVTGGNLVTTTSTANGNWAVGTNLTVGGTAAINGLTLTVPYGSATVASNITATSGDIQATAGTILTGVGIDAVGNVDMDYGSADVDDHTFITDGTGDAEIVLPDDSIGDAEIAFDEVTGADLTLTDCGVITSSGRVTGTQLACNAGFFKNVVGATTNLIFESFLGITNVIDADITDP